MLAKVVNCYTENWFQLSQSQSDYKQHRCCSLHSPSTKFTTKKTSCSRRTQTKATSEWNRAIRRLVCLLLLILPQHINHTYVSCKLGGFAIWLWLRSVYRSKQSSDFNMSSVARLGIHTKLYQALVRAAEPMVPAKLQPLWNHPAGW